MAKVTITIEDKRGGRVSIVADPNFETMIKQKEAGEDWTSAQGYAIFVLNQLREESKRQGPIGLHLPKIGPT